MVRVEQVGEIRPGVDRRDVALVRLLVGRRAGALQRHVEAARFFELPPEILPAQPMPDSFQYDLTIEDGGRSHTVTTTQDAAPTALQALLHATREELQKGEGSQPA